MTRLHWALCASLAAIRHCQQVGSLCPPSLGGTRAEGDGLRSIGKEERKEGSFSIERIKEKKEAEK